MHKVELLFIGGCADGQLKTVNGMCNKLPSIEVPVPNERPLLPAVLVNGVERELTSIHHYHPQEIIGNETSFLIMVYEHLTVDCALRMLLESYVKR